MKNLGEKSNKEKSPPRILQYRPYTTNTKTRKDNVNISITDKKRHIGNTDLSRVFTHKRSA